MSASELEKEVNKREETPELDLSFNLLDVIGAVWRWRKMVILLTAVIVAGTVVVTLLLPNYYKATLTIVPANEEKDLFGESTKNNGLYGDEDAIDRAIIFANSAPLVGFMIDSFKLAERYKINTSTAKGEDKVAKRFRKLYDVKKNEYSGIELSIEDTDPVLAAQMLEALKNRLAELYKQATAPNKALLLETYETALKDKRKDLQRMSDSLMLLRQKYNIYDVKQQGELLAEMMVNAESQLAESQAKLDAFRAQGGKRDSIINLTAKVRGLSRKLEMLRSQSDSSNSTITLKSYNEGREQILAYEDQIESLTEDMGEIQTEYAQFKAQAQSKAEAIIVLEPVEIPKVKSYPKRSIFVIAAAFLAGIIGIMGALVLELNKRIDWKTVLKD
jgi:uncharacterized protein involved in exopolysaccharide biosynthesis